MIAQLNLYEDCTSEEPSKVFTCNRLILKAAKKIDELSRKAAKTKDEAEQTNLTIEILQSLFPSFKAEDFENVDVVEYQHFIKAIGIYAGYVIEQASKN